MHRISTKTGQVHALQTRIDSSPCAILSCGWDYEKYEFDLWQNSIHGLPGPGLANLDRARVIAASRNIEWLWTAAHCVNRLDKRDFNDSINYSSQLFKRSAVCLVYLYDLELDQEPIDGWETALRQCEWMHRVWTVHELIFSKQVEFYNRNWVLIGTKTSLSAPLSKITCIDQTVLENPDRLVDFSVGHKISWVASCVASRIEDFAYSLIGIFGVTMPIAYGEGDVAFLNLQNQIAKTTNDGTLFAWQRNDFQKYMGIFAKSPSDFLYMSYSHREPLRIRGDVEITNDGLFVSDRFDTYEDGKAIILTMWPDKEGTDEGQGLGIILSEQNGGYMRCMPHHTLDVKRVSTRPIGEIFIENGLGCRTLENPKYFPVFPRDYSNASGFNPSYFLLKQTYLVSQNTVESTETFLPKPDPEPCFDSKCKSLTLRPHPGIYDKDHLETSTDDSSPDLDFIDSSSIKEESCFVLNIGPNSEDMKSRSGNPSQPHLRVYDEKTSETIMRLKGIGLKEYFSWVAEGQSLGKRTREDTPVPCTSLRLRKRAKVESSPRELSIECATDSEDEDTTVITTHSYPKRFFACPLYAENESGNISCLKNVNLLSIDDVINHLLAVHKRPYYCPICGDIFPNCTARDNHIIARTCTPGPLPDTSGIGEGQIRQVCYDLTALQTKEVQWYMIWDALFPEQQQPEQPYLCSDFEHTVCLMREFWMRKGLRIVSEHLNTADKKEISAESCDLDDICGAVLNRMIEEFLEGPRH